MTNPCYYFLVYISQRWCLITMTYNIRNLLRCDTGVKMVLSSKFQVSTVSAETPWGNW